MHKNCSLITAVSGFAVLALGALSSWYAFPKIVDSQIHSNIDLIEGTQSYKIWKKQPFPLKFKVYLFNVSNAEEAQLGAAPRLKEIGPFVYDEYREKIDVQTDEARDTLKYILKKTYFFNKIDSACHDEDDLVTIVNPAILGTALQVEAIMASALPMVNEAIPFLFPGTNGIFLTIRVKDILFNGLTLSCQDEAVDFMCGALGGALPKTIRQAENGKDFIFSMFGHLNGSDDGPWEMGRGLKNTTKGQVYSYDGQSEMTIWDDKYCNMINGSDSTVFETYDTERPPKLYTFAQDFCRSLYVNYEMDTVAFDLPVIRYTSKSESLANSPENECFCPSIADEDGVEHMTCPPSGMADITKCMKAPVLISYPHFYLGDPKLLKYVNGLEPTKEKHENFVLLEPRTGTPVSGRKRVQMNMMLKRLNGIDILQNVSEGIFPILWIEEGVTIPDDLINMLVSNFGKIGILTTVKWIMIVSGVVIIFIAFGLAVKREQLLCFTNNSSVNITTISRNGEPEVNRGEYPEAINKNFTDQFAQRQRNNVWDSSVWRN